MTGTSRTLLKIKPHINRILFPVQTSFFSHCQSNALTLGYEKEGNIKKERFCISKI